jgi:hypothetical protein
MVQRICGRRATMTCEFEERLITRAAPRALVSSCLLALRGERSRQSFLEE